LTLGSDDGHGPGAPSPTHMPNRHEPLPAFIQPQLSKLVKAPPAGQNWAHELKYDGYRIHARLVGGEVRLLTRTGLDWTGRYEATARAVSVIAAKAAYLDGELCAVRPDGTTSFPELQAATNEHRTTNLVYFVFDLLFLDGKKLAGLPLLERKQHLQMRRCRRRSRSRRHGLQLSRA
jgi:ATP-dependent DNA ligase